MLILLAVLLAFDHYHNTVTGNMVVNSEYLERENHAAMVRQATQISQTYPPEEHKPAPRLQDSGAATRMFILLFITVVAAIIIHPEHSEKERLAASKPILTAGGRGQARLPFKLPR